MHIPGQSRHKHIIASRYNKSKFLVVRALAIKLGRKNTVLKLDSSFVNEGCLLYIYRFVEIITIWIVTKAKAIKWLFGILGGRRCPTDDLQDLYQAKRE